MNLDAHAIASYVRELEFMNQKLREENERMKKEILNPRFKGTAITTEAVAMIHGVCPATVRHYVHKGTIPLHPTSTDRKLLVCTHDALLIDFQEQRKHH